MGVRQGREKGEPALRGSAGVFRSPVDCWQSSGVHGPAAWGGAGRPGRLRSRPGTRGLSEPLLPGLEERPRSAGA